MTSKRWKIDYSLTPELDFHGALKAPRRLLCGPKLVLQLVTLRVSRFLFRDLFCVSRAPSFWLRDLRRVSGFISASFRKPFGATRQKSWERGATRSGRSPPLALVPPYRRRGLISVGGGSMAGGPPFFLRAHSYNPTFACVSAPAGPPPPGPGSGEGPGRPPGALSKDFSHDSQDAHFPTAPGA